jgi:AcrR family transcriptional regulator
MNIMQFYKETGGMSWRSTEGDTMSQMTKKALAASLKKILQKKPLSQITINEITEGCGVNRMTFYYHFKDIYDLVEWICMEDAEKILRGKKISESWEQKYLSIFQMLQDESRLILSLSRSASRERLTDFLNDLVFNLMIGMVEEESADLDISEHEKIFVADFYKYALGGILLNWIDGDMKDDPARLAVMAQGCMSGSINDILKYFHNKKECSEIA